MGLLAQPVELAIVRSLLHHEIGPDSVDPKTLSFVGQKFHQAISKLISEFGDKWDVDGALLLATGVFELDRAKAEEYLIATTKAPDSGRAIYELIHDRDILLKLNNEITKQLTTGGIDVSRLQAYFATKITKSDLVSVADDLREGVPPPPGGPNLESLPLLSSKTNGMYGVYIIAGIPAVGKSTLALQIAVDVSREQPVLIYDHENGRMVLVYRLAQNWGLEGSRKIGKKIYIREGLRSLTRDLQQIKPPATLVVDSVQKISTRTEDRRAGLDDWIHRFEELKKQGYNVILVSEVNRASYTGDPRLDCFKDTGALEYAADTALFLQESDAPGLLKTWIVKNRHYEFNGYLGLIERDPKRPMWFNEVTEDVWAA